MLNLIKQNFYRNKIIFNTFRNTYCNSENSLKTKSLPASLLQKYEHKLLYNSVIENMKPKKGYRKNRIAETKRQKLQNKVIQQKLSEKVSPISLKYFLDIEEDKEEKHTDEEEHQTKITQFPFESGGENIKDEINIVTEKYVYENHAEFLKNEVRERSNIINAADNEYNTKLWMSGYSSFDDNLDDIDSNNDQGVYYGTPDPLSKISNVPCGGCGALLHCKDTAIPGYLPSEIYKNCNKKGAATLQSVICQRCYFLQNYNVALNTRISADDYPKVLETISDKKALVILMVDLLDFPCSIWPGIADIFNRKTPIVLVGNKIDLIPRDCDNFITNIKRNLMNYTKLFGFGSMNILHVELISAKTGYGVEKLISALYSVWKNRGDVYLVGCTNVGKSSLFNALLKSDYCKVQSSDLIQRATTSQWPGTTLNLLKFPITRLSDHKMYLRNSRLQAEQKISKLEKVLYDERLRISNTTENATLIGQINRTFTKQSEAKESSDLFSLRMNSNSSGQEQLGVDEKDPRFSLGRWCFDTPGVVQPDQIVHLLTADELISTLPKVLIRPQSFCVKPGTSLFIAGLARLDYVKGPKSVRLTVFRSNELPITVTTISEAEEIYEEFLRTDLFKVPSNDEERLKKWPGLQLTKTFSLNGSDWKMSLNDVVLSSAGWISVNCGGGSDNTYEFQAWTPEKRGCYVRDSLLPKAVVLRGARLRKSPAYKEHKFI